MPSPGSRCSETASRPSVPWPSFQICGKRILHSIVGFGEPSFPFSEKYPVEDDYHDDEAREEEEVVIEDGM